MYNRFYIIHVRNWCTGLAEEVDIGTNIIEETLFGAIIKNGHNIIIIIITHNLLSA